MIRIRFMQDGVEVHRIDEGGISVYSLGGKKLISDDFFMNEPASVELEILFDLWLNERWESESIKIGDSVWFKIPIEIDMIDPISGMYMQNMVGLIDLTQCESDPFKHRMKLVIYDYSALLSQLDERVRFYYPYTPEGGTDWSRYIINYALDGEEANEPGEEHMEGTQFMPYAHSIELHSRQISDILAALSSIWRKSFEGLWDLGFRHEYNEVSGEAEVVQNMIVELSHEQSFYPILQAMLSAIGSHKMQNSASADYTQTWVNYGLLSSSARSEIYAEYGLLLRVECDAFFVVRSGYDARFGNEWEAHEWYRILALKSGREVYDSGQRARHYGGISNIDALYIGETLLDSGNEIDEGRYRSSANDLGLPAGFENNPEGYYSQLAYYVYYSGILGDEIPAGGTGYVLFGSHEHFYDVFIHQLVEPVYLRYTQLATSERVFWANYGLVPASMRSKFRTEYGITPDDECDGWLLIRAGYTYIPVSRDSYHDPGVEIDPGTWTDGEGGGDGGGGNAITSHEDYRIFALRDGEVVRDYGVKRFGRQGNRNGSSLGGYELSPGTTLDIGENLYYAATNNDLYAEGVNNPDALSRFEYRLSYSVLGQSGWLANRIYRMKPIASAASGELYLEQSLRDWFKLMFFIGDLSCYAGETGLITFAPREAKGTVSMVWESMISAKKQLLIYQPWDRERLGEYIDDRAEIEYLIEYYGGHRVLSHALEFEFVTRGWESFPGLRDRFALSGADGSDLALLGSGWYMVVEIRFDGVKKVFIRAVRV